MEARGRGEGGRLRNSSNPLTETPQPDLTAASLGNRYTALVWIHRATREGSTRKRNTNLTTLHTAVQRSAAHTNSAESLCIYQGAGTLAA